jgi:hypothetical protein
VREFSKVLLGNRKCKFFIGETGGEHKGKISSKEEGSRISVVC